MPSPVYFWEGFRFAMSTWHKFPHHNDKSAHDQHMMMDPHFEKMYLDEQNQPTLGGQKKIRKNDMNKICKQHAKRVVWFVALIWTLDNWNLPRCGRGKIDESSMDCIQQGLLTNIMTILEYTHRMLSFSNSVSPSITRSGQWRYMEGEEHLMDIYADEDHVKLKFLPNDLNDVLGVSALTEGQTTSGRLTDGHVTRWSADLSSVDCLYCFVLPRWI